MSSAILYLAIVAIWAVVLVPRWLRLRSAPARYEPAEDFEDTADLEDTADAETDGTVDTRRAPIEWEDSPPPSYELFDTPEAASPGHPADPVEPSDSPGEDAAAEHEEPVPAAASGSRPVAVPSAAERRARVLRARRRMLVTVVSLAAAATVLAAVHLAPVWIVIPPALMLAGFLVLLREAAHTDALREWQQPLARGRSSAEAGQEEDGPVETPAAPAATAAPAEDAPEPQTGQFGEATAQVIDISQRFGDQLYDQYTDAAERAVGD